MNNANSPAMPLPLGSETTFGCEGLTKREMIAMHIMSGLVADGTTTFEGCGEAKCAVRWADALLAELEATK